MAAKKSDNKAFSNIEQRLDEANKTHELIGRFAYGKEPETLSMPSELSGTPLGGSFTTPLNLPDPNDDAARVPLGHMLTFKNEGINTADPGEIVRRGWNLPPETPTAKGPLMQRYSESRKKAPTVEEKVNLLGNKLREITTNPSFVENKKELGLSSTSTPETVFDKMVQSRRGHFSAQLTDWYEGPRTKVNQSGYPEYAKGSAVSAIEQRAEVANIPQEELRRGVALGSPKTVWQSKSGHMPNLEGSARTMEIARSEPSLSPEDVSAKMKSEFKQKKSDKSTILGNMAKIVARSSRGELSRPHEPTTPASGDLIGTEKVANFDRGLVNPYHPEYGYSSYVAWQKSRGHTSDTHDFGAAGVKTPSVQVLDESGKPRYKRTKEGNLVPITTNAGETWAEKVGGQDILGATARIASAERFKEDYDRIGREQGESAQYQWARENAHKYTPNNAQANQWEESMRRNKVKSATRRAEAVKKRNKKK